MTTLPKRYMVFVIKAAKEYFDLIKEINFTEEENCLRMRCTEISESPHFLKWLMVKVSG